MNRDNKDTVKTENNTIIYGNINAPTQIGGNNIFNTNGCDDEPKATYEAVPIWRSPFTLAVLTWLSATFGLLAVIPFWSIVKPVLGVLNGTVDLQSDSNTLSVIVFGLLLIITVLLLYMRSVAKSQTMQPLMRGFAIDGHGRRIVFQRVRAGACPICGGKMKYYNKPIEWNANREVLRRMPALECTRNPEHVFWVDIAEKATD